jgi:hypothetical protein
MAEEFRSLAWAMGFETGLVSVEPIIDAALALVGELGDAENAWQGVGVVAVDIRKIVDLRVALREAGFLNSKTSSLQCGGPDGSGPEELKASQTVTIRDIIGEEFYR